MAGLQFSKFKEDRVRMLLGEGHIARQCTQPKRPKNSAWFKEKLLLVEAQESGQVLDEEQLAFLADPGVADNQATQTITTHNAAFQADDLDAYDSDCDDFSSAKSDFGKRFVPQAELSAEQAFWLQSSNPNSNETGTSNTHVKIDVPSDILKVSLVNSSLKKLKYHFTSFDKVVKVRTTPDAITEGAWGFKHTKGVFLTKIISFLKTLKDIFNVFDKNLLDEISKVQMVFNQMEAAVEQCSVDKKSFDIQQKQFFIENDRILEQIMSQDIVHIVMTSSIVMCDSEKKDEDFVENYNKCLELEAKLVKKKYMIEKYVYNELSKSYSKLEKH
ncbi:hypothetical protein Tco_0516992 [Tanacetum coccineum]